MKLPMLARSLVASTLLSAVSLGADEPVTIFVVRHADRPSDDRLTPTGLQRAEELSESLRSVSLDSVFSTRTVRTMQTAAPSALASGVEITPYGGSWMPGDWTRFVERLTSGEAGSNVLVVGHSNTVPQILELLGVEARSAETYGDLFVVTLQDGAARLAVRRVEVIEHVGSTDFTGDITAPTDLSAIASTEDGAFVVVGSDEMHEGTKTNRLDILRRRDTDYVWAHAIEVPVDGEDDEIDIEAITRHGASNVFYAVGSHSYVRKNVTNRPRSYEKNWERFIEDSPDPRPSRDRLVRLEIDAGTGELLGAVQDVRGLRKKLDEEDVFEHFGEIPSKENGIDIEGLASDGKSLFVGFRGPVFRFGFAPVLVFEPERVRQAELRFVALDGRGIRDMARVEGGFLVLAGAIGDSALSQAIYFWNGETCFPGAREDGDPPVGVSVRLGGIGTPAGGKAEGLLLLSETDEHYELLVIYDGVAGGAPTRLRARRPELP